MRYSARSSGGLLEAGNLGAENKSLRGAHRFDRIKQFLTDPGVLTGKIKHLNGLWVADRHICHGISLSLNNDVVML
jgi:hypothetical protein